METETSHLNVKQLFISHIEGLKESHAKVDDVQFPIDVFPVQMQHIITETNGGLNFPIDFISASLLFAAATAIGNTYKVYKNQAWSEPCLLWVVLVGRPGTNKSHPLNFALRPIQERDKELYRIYKNELANHLLDPDSVAKPTLKKSIVADITPEALAKVLVENERGISVYYDELAAWFANIGRYNKSGEEQQHLSMWQQKELLIDRKNSPSIRIDDPFVCIGGTIQPGPLSNVAKGREDNGFLDRMLFVCPDDLKKDYWNDGDIAPAVVDAWGHIINNLFSLEQKFCEDGIYRPNLLRFTTDAMDVIKRWQMKNTDECNATDNEVVASMYTKFDNYVLRFSLLLQLFTYACTADNSDKQVIGTNAAEGAVKLCEYFKKMALKVRLEVIGANVVEKLSANWRAWYALLPDEFETKDALKIASDCKAGQARATKNMLNNRTLFRKCKQGVYEKLF